MSSTHRRATLSILQIVLVVGASFAVLVSPLASTSKGSADDDLDELEPIVTARILQSPPTVYVDSPADGTIVNVTIVIVSGRCDLGTTVWVNGVLASNGGTSWSAVLPLKVGVNTITVTAEDEFGNEAEAQTRTVTYTPPPYAMQDDIDDVNARIDDADAFSSMLMYLSIILFLVTVILIGSAWYALNRKIGSRGSVSRYSPPGTEEVESTPSDVEREFEQLEKEIGREDR